MEDKKKERAEPAGIFHAWTLKGELEEKAVFSKAMDMARQDQILKCIKELESHENHCQNCADDNISIAIAILNKMKVE